jgi:chromosome segregation ATPase
MNILGRIIQNSLDANFTSLSFEIICDLKGRICLNKLSQLMIASMEPSTNSKMENVVNHHAETVTDELPHLENSELTKLFNFYEHKLSVYKKQETLMLTHLNQYNSSSLLAEVELKMMRDQMRTQSLKENKLKQELFITANKLKEIEQKYKTDIVDCQGKIDELKQRIESMDKDNEEAIAKLQEALGQEKNYKRDLTQKIKDWQHKHMEIEKLNKELTENNAELTESIKNKVENYEKLEAECSKVKSILKYVKEANF